MAAGLPQQNKKPYNRMTTQECLDADDIPEGDLVSSRTVNGYLKLCQGLFAYLVKEEDVLESSPTNNVKFEAKSRSYGSYSFTEMRKLVAYFATLEDWKKWVFLLLAYTGARRSEIAALNVSDIRLDDDSQRHYIMIQDSKTDAGIRQIPLSLRLVEMNFFKLRQRQESRCKTFPSNH
ncbi:tyrosine-type recombinase/integrase [Citrobacter amalonaticus]|nr:tyrosine-type recombinase/integrase [Citrobacter amalonaticus]